MQKHTDIVACLQEEKGLLDLLVSVILSISTLFFLSHSQYLSVASEMLASGCNSPIMACDTINRSITHSDTVTVFEPRLKTHLFNAAYN